MELAQYIKKLLYNHDILIIPGLGGLITQYKPAEINSNDHTISPPSKYLAFDPHLTVSDEVLVNFIAKQKSISVQEAELFVEDEVKSMKTRLENEETILLEGIGYFSKGENGLRFEREPEANFLTDTFGLSNIDYKKVEYHITPNINPEILEKGKKRSYSLFWIPIAIIGVVVISFAVYLNYPDIVYLLKNKKAKTSISMVTVQPKKDSIKDITHTEVPKDTSKKNDLENFFDNSTDKKKALSLESDPKASKPKVDLTYYLIAGSFKTYDRAKVLANSLTKDGFKPEIIQFEQDKYRVSLGEFKDKDKAQAEFERITTAKGADAVWILKK